MLTQEPLYVITKPNKVKEKILIRNPRKTRRGKQKPRFEENHEETKNLILTEEVKPWI